MPAGGGIFWYRIVGRSQLGCFSSQLYLGITHSLHAEMSAAMITIEIAHRRGWHILWLECDPVMVIFAFSSLEIVPWRLRFKNKMEKLSTSLCCYVLSGVPHFQGGPKLFYLVGPNFGFYQGGLFCNRFGFFSFRFRQFLLLLLIDQAFWNNHLTFCQIHNQLRDVTQGPKTLISRGMKIKEIFLQGPK